MLRVLSLVAVAMLLALGVAACVHEEEEEAPEPTLAARATTSPLSPSITLGACRGGVVQRSDPAIIASSILSRQSQEFVFDSKEFAALSGELEQILESIRDGYPATASIHARDDRYVPGQIILELESSLKEAIRNVVASQASTELLATGQAQFDALSAEMGGARGMNMSRDMDDWVLLCLDELVNVRPASEAYSKLEGVRYAGPNHVGGDGPDIDASRDGDTWYVVFRNAWGDCPAGCMHQELMYFTVTGDTVTSVEASQVAADPNFPALVNLVSGPFNGVPLSSPTAPAQSTEGTVSPVSESCSPVLPATYTGVAYLNGDVAPVGSAIQAVQAGMIWGTTTVGAGGGYEMNAPEPMRLSPPCSPDGPMSFRLGDLLANESAEWRPGPIRLDLTFVSPTATAGQ